MAIRRERTLPDHSLLRALEILSTLFSSASTRREKVFFLFNDKLPEEELFRRICLLGESSNSTFLFEFGSILRPLLVLPCRYG